MSAHPNWGSVSRGLFLTHPGWGGNVLMADAICAKYGPALTWIEDIDPVLFCRLYAAFDYHKERNDWVREEISRNDSPRLDWIRLFMVMNPQSTRAQAEWARDYFAAHPEFENIGRAEKYDLYIASRFGFDLIEEEVTRRARASARKALAHDPYNPRLIRILQTPVPHKTILPEGQMRVETVEGPSPEEVADYARRLVISAPFDPKHWNALAATLRIRDPGAFETIDAYMINAIVYSLHDPELVQNYLYKRLRWISLHDKLTAMDEADRTTGWRKAWLDATPREALVCPALRGWRVFQALCDGRDAVPGCAQPQEQPGAFEALLEQARAAGQCGTVLNAPIDTLFYSPIGFDLTLPED
ncbi:MAG: hypothetical protein R3D85_06105 [Paracoccaceae bacterium]